jgi:hypothetical protein
VKALLEWMPVGGAMGVITATMTEFADAASIGPEGVLVEAPSFTAAEPASGATGSTPENSQMTTAAGTLASGVMLTVVVPAFTFLAYQMSVIDVVDVIMERAFPET